jgi:hypothetical protein
MGRPLNKKYFGNRNIGSASTTADDGIGGTSVASVTLGTLGSYTVRPTITFSAPDLSGDGAVTALGTVTSEVLSATIVGGSGGSGGYTTGNILTVTTAVGTATFTVTASAGSVTTVAPLDRGSFTGPLATGAQATTVVVGAGTTTGTGCTLVLTYRAKTIVITEPGSGYSHAVDATASFSGSATLPGTPTVVMITDTGIIGTVGNQENAINMTAFLTGGSAVQCDIIRQVSTDRYLVTDGTRTGIVKLQSTLADAAGEGSIAATDSAGGQYFVTKLTARRATVTRAGGSGWLYATNQSAPWSFDAAADIYLQIANT